MREVVKNKLKVKQYQDGIYHLYIALENHWPLPRSWKDEDGVVHAIIRDCESVAIRQDKIWVEL